MEGVLKQTIMQLLALAPGILALFSSTGVLQVGRCRASRCREHQQPADVHG